MEFKKLKSLFRRNSRHSLDKQSMELIGHNGVNYLDYIQILSGAMKAKRYLEIGTSSGASLARIDCISVAIDPMFEIKIPVIGTKPACHFYQITSDDYLGHHDPKAVLGGTIDLAFLDGMHRYEFLLRDFMNTEKHSARNSIVLLHDCLPPTFEMTNREGTSGKYDSKYKHYWTGDVWKVVDILKKWRPDIKMRLLDCVPTGIVALTSLDPFSDILSENYERIISDFAPHTSDFEKLQVFLTTNQPDSSRAIPPSELLRLFGQ